MDFNYSLTPGYLDFFVNSYKAVRWHLRDHDWRKLHTGPQLLISDIRYQFRVGQGDIQSVLYWAIGFTIIRYFFQMFSKLLVSRLNMDVKSDSDKFPESFWKCIVYSIFWGYNLYLLTCVYDYFINPFAVWNDWSINMRIPSDIRLLYIVECGFYIHSIYATIFMDTVRKDFIVMMIHHLLTFGLISGSYAMKYHKVGMMVMFVHDGTDILLEFSKCNYYLKMRNGKFHKLNDKIASLGFVLFAGSWVLLRLYWFPLKVMYAGGVVAQDILISQRGGGGGTLWFFLYILLWTLFCLNIYWFYLILLIVIKPFKGKELSDVRETRDELKKKK